MLSKISSFTTYTVNEYKIRSQIEVFRRIRLEAGILPLQGCHGTGKTGNLEVHFSRQGKHREFAKNI